MDLWIGRGVPLNPHPKGVIVDAVPRSSQPKQLELVPSVVLWSEGEQDNLEYTLYHHCNQLKSDSLVPHYYIQQVLKVHSIPSFHGLLSRRVEAALPLPL